MKRIAPLALTVLVGGALPVQAGNHEKSHEGTPVVIIGEVTSQPKDYGFMQEKKLQVSAGPSMGEHTLHLSKAMLQDYYGRKRGISDIHDKMWVRAEGRQMKDSRRIKVSKLEIIGNDRTAFHNSVYFQPQTANGSITTVTSSVAGSRQTLSDPMADAYLGYRTQGRDTDMEATGPEGIWAQLPLSADMSAEDTMYYAAPEDALYDDMSGELFYSSPSPDVTGDTLNQDTSSEHMAYEQMSYDDAHYEGLYDEFMDAGMVISDVPADEAMVMPDESMDYGSDNHETNDTSNVYDPDDEAAVHSDEIVDQELLGSQLSSDMDEQNLSSDDAYYDGLYDEFMYEEMLNDQPSDIVPDGTLDLREDSSTDENIDQNLNENSDESVDPMLEEGC